MKNSVATNLLILDETFDSSLDYEGVDNLMKIIYGLDEKQMSLSFPIRVIFLMASLKTN
jgi:hypothetical protein